MAKVLIVDDEKSIRATLAEFVREDGHEVRTAESAVEALRLAEVDPPDVVVTDIILPRMSGVELLGRIHERFPDIQVIMITGEPTVETAADAVRLGAFDYLAKPISSDAVRSTVARSARVKELVDDRRRLEIENLRYREHLEEEVDRRGRALRESEERHRAVVENSVEGILVVQGGLICFANPSAAALCGYTLDVLLQTPFVQVLHPKDASVMEERHALRLQENAVLNVHSLRLRRGDGGMRWVELRPVSFEWDGRPATLHFVRDVTDERAARELDEERQRRVQRALDGTIEAIGRATETRDPYTAGHQRRMTELSVALARRLGLDESVIEATRAAGLLHDIGKLSIPAEILSKPSALSPLEMSLIKTHPQSAYEVLKSIDFPWPVANIVLQHQERMDGSGYPRGLVGDAILVEARILAVADVVEAMSSHRPYRAALGIEAALAEIERGRGALYDTLVVDACLDLFRVEGFRFSSA
jgi:PAS domain S-box-containing protein/putative nucleotidyltransferase with HDIG domain